MKWLIILLSVLIGSVLLALLAAQEPGYVLIIYQGWKLETSLTLLVTVLAVGGILLYYLVRSLSGVARAPKRFTLWRSRRRESHAESSLNQGMVALYEGDWVKAEKLLSKKSRTSHAPLLNYLGAAQAAQELGAYDRRDQYLTEATKVEPEAKIAIGLTQARLLMEQKQHEQALACLEQLRRLSPKHRYVLRLLAQLYAQLSDWQRLEDLLAVLKKQQVFADEELLHLQHDCYQQLLAQYAEKYDYRTLHQLWRRMPKAMHEDGDVVARYAQLLVGMGEQDEAEAILHTSLQRNWHSGMLELYGKVAPNKMDSQLAQAERWLQRHPDDPLLLLTLGRISVRNQLWGKAKEYLQRSADMGQREAYVLLTEVLEQLNEPALAQEYYRKGVKLLTASSSSISAR